MLGIQLKSMSHIFLKMTHNFDNAKLIMDFEIPGFAELLSLLKNFSFASIVRALR